MNDILDPGSDWAGRLLVDPQRIDALIERTQRIAVIGIKPESRSSRPAYYVPRYLADVGFEVIPVPVYYPEVTEILGRPVYRRLTEVPGPIDVALMFRRPEHLSLHVQELLAKRPSAVWFQLGIRNDDVAQALARAGMEVVQDRCMMVEHRRIREKAS